MTQERELLKKVENPKVVKLILHGFLLKEV